jgi:Skp family chaperone for outer membrane proteins
MRTKITRARCAVVLFLLLQPPSWAQNPQKIGGVNVQEAIFRIQEGQKHRAELEAKYGPVEERIRGMQTGLDGLRERFQRGEQTLSDDARVALMSEIDRKSKSLDRAVEDAREDFQYDQERLLGGVSSRLLGIVTEYASRNDYALVVDSSSLSASVLLVAAQADITEEIIREYDRKFPVSGDAKQTAGSQIRQ